MRRKLFAIFAICSVLLSACNPSEDELPLAVIYISAFEALMEEDNALNHDMAFIAIDFSNIENLNETSKQEIMDYFSAAYEIEVMDATFEELREKGFFNEEIMRLDGVLLEKEKVDFSQSKILFTGSKYRSGLGAIGMEVTLKKKGGKWQVTEANIIWMS